MQRWVFYMTLQKQNGKIQVKHKGERLYNDDEKIGERQLIRLPSFINYSTDTLCFNQMKQT